MANKKGSILVGLITAIETVTDRAVLLLPESLRRVLRRIYPLMMMVEIYVNIRAYMHNIHRYWRDSKSLKVKEHKDHLAVEIGKYNNIDNYHKRVQVAHIHTGFPEFQQVFGPDGLCSVFEIYRYILYLLGVIGACVEFAGHGLVPHFLDTDGICQDLLIVIDLCF